MFDPQGRLYACEGGGRRVVRYEADGSTTVLADGFEGKRLNVPNDVAVDSSGNVLTVQENECIVQKFNSTGTKIASWNFEKPWTCQGFRILDMSTAFRNSMKQSSFLSS